MFLHFLHYSYMHNVSWEFNCIISHTSNRVPSLVTPLCRAMRLEGKLVGAWALLLTLPSGHAAGLNDDFDLTHIY